MANPASSVILFLNSKGLTLAKIHLEVMSKGEVKQWHCEFNNSHTNLYDERGVTGSLLYTNQQTKLS